LVLTKQAWTDIVHLLKVPHFSYTKRIGLIHEKYIPIIFDEDILLPHLHITYDLLEYQPCMENTTRLAIHQCKDCLEETMRYDSRLELMVCIECGSQAIHVETPSYVRSSRALMTARMFSNDFSKRLSHFRFWLKRIQGKERHHVTDQVIQDVRALLSQDNCRGIHYWTIRNALRRLGYQIFYDNTVYIMGKIRGTPLVMMTSSQEQQLIKMFLELQKAFEALHNRRVNMLSYPYLIKKLCELKHWHRMAKVIPTLKSRTRIIIQDELWHTICEYNKWPFIPTMQWTYLDTRSVDGKLH
jgi:hypothetical protein